MFMMDENGATPRRLAELNGHGDVVEVLDGWRDTLFRQFLYVVETIDGPRARRFADNTLPQYEERVQLLTAATDTCGPYNVHAPNMVEFLLETYGYTESDLSAMAKRIRRNTPITEQLEGPAAQAEKLLLSRTLHDWINKWSADEIADWIAQAPKNIDINRVWDGKAALHNLAMYGDDKDIDKVRLLLNLGADPRARSGDGYTAEQLARHRGSTELANILQVER